MPAAAQQLSVVQVKAPKKTASFEAVFHLANQLFIQPA